MRRSPEAIEEGDPSHRYLGPIMQVCGRLAELVDEAVGQGQVPLVLGGDHAIAMGSLGGMARRHGPGAVLWIDAHGDLNRPSTSPTGNVHGMPLAAALGAAGDAFVTDDFPMPVGDEGGARRRPLTRSGRARADRRSSGSASSR